MNLKDKFTYRSQYGEYDGCRYVAGRYYDGNPALRIFNEDGPICVCSVNPPGEKLADGEIAVKDWSENSGMDNWLKLHGVVCREDPIRRIPSGFVEIPIYRLTPAGKELFENV